MVEDYMIEKLTRDVTYSHLWRKIGRALLGEEVPIPAVLSNGSSMKTERVRMMRSSGCI